MQAYICTFCLLLSFSVKAQFPAFYVGPILGFNSAKFEGSEFASHFGINTGLRAEVFFAKKFYAGIELLYSVNGEYIYPTYPHFGTGKTKFKYVELPLFAGWKIPLASSKGKGSGISFELGTAYTKIFKHYIESDLGIDISDQFIYEDTDAWLIQCAMWGYYNSNFRLGAKLTIPTYSQELDPTFTFRMAYLFG